MVAKGNRGRRLRGPFLLSALPGGLQPERGKRGGGVGGRRQTGACARFTAQTESGGGGVAVGGQRGVGCCGAGAREQNQTGVASRCPSTDTHRGPSPIKIRHLGYCFHIREYIWDRVVQQEWESVVDYFQVKLICNLCKICLNTVITVASKAFI